MSLRLAVITARRADYGIILPLLKTVKADPELELDLIVTADHYWPQYGETVKEIQADGFEIDHCWIPYGKMTNVLADITHALTVKWAKAQPDVLIVLGDTDPMLAGAIVASHMNIPVCHIQGGDLTGSIDNKIRYAITALADYHFPSLSAHADRLKSMGIPVSMIKIVGPLGVYAMKDTDFYTDLALRSKLQISDKPIILVIQHPVTNEAGRAGDQMQVTLDAVSQFPDYQPVIIYPNSDTGNEAMVKVIEDSHFIKFKSLPYLMFLSLLKYSKVIVGNSSAGLVEAPFFGVPCVNIGTRQNGRTRGIQCYDVDYKSDRIREQIEWILKQQKIRYSYVSPYQLDIDGVSEIIKTLKENHAN